MFFFTMLISLFVLTLRGLVTVSHYKLFGGERMITQNLTNFPITVIWTENNNDNSNNECKFQHSHLFFILQNSEMFQIQDMSIFHIPLRRIKILSEFKISNTVNQIVVKIALEAYCLLPMKVKDMIHDIKRGGWKAEDLKGEKKKNSITRRRKIIDYSNMQIHVRGKM